MLSAEEKHDIAHEFSGGPYRQSTSIEALKIVQRHRGWVSDEALKDVAEFLGVSPAELENVATFYNLIFRRPVGRHIILLCHSVSCWIMGGESIQQIVSRQLGIGFGETSQDGRFTLLPNPCLGICDHAPAMMVDHDLYHDLSIDKLDGIWERYR